MKKIIIFLFVLTSIILSFNKEERIVIPKDSIRYRIIASDDSKESQALKWQVNTTLMPILTDIMNSSDTLETSRASIQKNLPLIKQTLDSQNIPYSISFGQNYFPKKEYKDVIYKEGDYESLVITLGKGNGQNWWCVMFPPLCLIDVKETGKKDIEYHSYVKDIINKYI